MLIFYLFLNCLLPAILLFLGVLWLKHPPQKINWVYGYRTGMSAKNEATWQFAHSYFGKVLRSSGGILLVLALSSFFIFKKDPTRVILWNSVLQVLTLFLSTIGTELALRKKFDSDGNPKIAG